MNSLFPVSFMWPEMLWLLLLVPTLIGLYFWLLKRKKKTALRYASLALVKSALGAGQRFRRHVPPLLFLMALTVMLLAIARPTAVVTLPTDHATVILALDVSRSMRAADVKPNRITAVQMAAKAFVADQPRNMRIGVVSFAATASLVQSPTLSRDEVIGAIDRFQLQRGTATGSAIVIALATLFPDAGITLDAISAQRNGLNSQPASTSLDEAAKAKPDDFTPVEPGSYKSAVIILLTDGRRTTGPDPIEIAKLAADRGVRVYTVGVGTTTGDQMESDGWSMRVTLDEEALKNIANITRAEYFYAGSGTDLTQIYSKLNTRLGFEKRETEITALFSALGALLALLAALLSLLWFNRLL
jgi:Ca-activated chloride channel family protein